MTAIALFNDSSRATLSKAAPGGGLPGAGAAVPTGWAVVWLAVAPVLVVLLLCVLLWPQPKPKVPKDGKGPRRFPEEEAAKAKRACHGRCQHRSLLGLGPRCKEHPCKPAVCVPVGEGRAFDGGQRDGGVQEARQGGGAEAELD